MPKYKVKRLSYDDLRREAGDFLEKYNPDGSLPVPIEEITEFNLKLDVVPVSGLQKHFDTDAFLSNDLKTITVDQYIFDAVETRYRFSLAHEISHLLLHADFFNHLKPFSTVNAWKDAVRGIPKEDYHWIEWQAYALAGLILVPSQPLKEHFDDVSDQLYLVEMRRSEASDEAKEAIEVELADRFCVSTAVIHKRIEKDRLWG